MSQQTKKRRNRAILVLFILYTLLIIKVIIFKFSFAQMQEIINGWQKGVIWEGLGSANFHLFKTIKLYVRHYRMPNINSFGNLFGNILVFIPFGFLLPMVHPICRHFIALLANTFVFVFGIEMFQLLSAFGTFDVDDILLNCTGAVLGYLVYVLLIHKGFNGTKNIKNL